MASAFSARWRRGVAAAVAGLGALATAGCYGPIVEGGRTIELWCEVFVNAMPYSQSVRTFEISTQLPEWTNPGGGTPFHVEVAPVEPEEGESGPYNVTLAAEGLVGALTFVSGTTPSGVNVTAEPGGDVVLRFYSIYRSEEIPGSYRISRSCTPYPGEDPEIARIPVRA